MILKCLSNKGSFLPTDFLLPNAGYGSDAIFTGIKPGEYYVVYGMAIFSGYIWYYLTSNDNPDYFPMARPAPLFEVVNGHLSKYWIYSFFPGKDRESSFTVWAFPEWVNDVYYYDSLSDDDETAVNIFIKYKALMDLEFPIPSVADKATVYDESWLGCPFCIDAWESTSTDGLVICPKCKHKLLNPRYKEFKNISSLNL